MKVYQAISKVSAAMSQQGISKGRKNQQQGYNFRGIDDVLNALSAALVDAGLVVLPRCVERECVERTTAKGGALFYVTCRVEFDLVCAEDGSKHTVCTFGEAMDSADKATNKAMSAAYKYLALLVFCIPTEATPDTDADYQTHEVAAKTPLTALAPQVQAKVRGAVAASLEAFNTGNEWGAFEEVSSLWNKYPEGDERNAIKLAINHCLKEHSALRASLKASAEQERANAKETA